MEELLELFRRRDHVSCLVLPGLEGVCVEFGEQGNGQAAIFLPSILTSTAL